MQDPPLKEFRVVRFHQLPAAIEIRFDPTAHVGKTFGHLAAAFGKTFVDWFGIAMAEAFDDHEEHGSNLTWRGPVDALTCGTPRPIAPSALPRGSCAALARHVTQHSRHAIAPRRRIDGLDLRDVLGGGLQRCVWPNILPHIL